METHVLIPPEFKLKVRPSSQCSSPSVAKLLEQQVTVVSNVELPKGVQIHPAQGTVRCGKLDIYSTLPENDIRTAHYGCYDEIINVLSETEESSKICNNNSPLTCTFPPPLSCRRVRRCNWTRFLTFEEDDDRVVASRANLKCAKNPHNGQVVYETLENIAPNTDLVVSLKFFDNYHSPRTELSSSTVIIRAIAAYMQESPLDLSQPLLHPIPNLLGSRLTESFSPVSTLEDRISVSSDSGVSSSEETDISGGRSSVVTETCKLLLASSPPSPPATPKTEDDIVSASLDKSHHVSSQNNNNKSRRNNKKMLPCSFCGKCFDRPSLLNRHLRTHTGERPHVCDICEKGFSTSSSLNTHRRIHSGEKPHECSTCGKRFTASSNLYYHRMTHVKEKPHKCDLCQKSFPTPGDLKSHMYIHNGSWPHRCHICDRGFSKVTNLKNHLFLHTGQKPHECYKCGKRFALGCNMKAHLKTHDTNRSLNDSGIEPTSKDSEEEMLIKEEEEEIMLNVTD